MTDAKGHRNGTIPTGPKVYIVPKEAKPVFDHPIADAWDKLGPQVRNYLDSINIKWTSIDVVRIDPVGADRGPPVLWIGVKPGSTSHEAAQVALVGCLGLLKKIGLSYDGAGIEIAMRESVFTRCLPGPQLFSSSNATVTDTPDVEGTSSLYIRDGSRIFALKARRGGVLPRDPGPSEHCDRPDSTQPRRDLHLSKTFLGILESIKDKILGPTIMDDHYNDRLEQSAGGEERTKVGGLSQKEKKANDPLNEFNADATKDWGAESPRVLGTGTNGFTEDWVLVEIDSGKIDFKTFKGNIIDLGTDAFIAKMPPDGTNPATFQYRREHLLPLQGIVKENELRHPTRHEPNGEPCLLVLKKGAATGLTTGRASGMVSYVREYFPDGKHETSVQMAIVSFSSHKDGGFSAPGDSGSIVAEPTGRIVGLLTGGAGDGKNYDISYATPFYWIWDERIKTRFPNACLYRCESEV